MSKELLFKENVRTKIAKGVETLAKAVKTTLGPKGRNVIIARGKSPIITKDGVTVANEIELKDPYENLGVQVVKEAAAKTASIAGDGTTTATVLAEAIYKEGLKCVASGYNPVLVQRGIDIAANDVCQAITNYAKEINDDKELRHIATISANNDVKLGRLISEAIIKTGKDGNITVEDSPTFNSSFSLVEGIQYNRGYISQYFINDPKKLRCMLDDPYILIHEKKISNLEDIFNILQMVKQKNRPLLIIAEDIEGEALTTLVINNARKIVNVCAVKSPGYGLKQKENLTDIAIHTGGTCVCVENNITLATTGLEHLGSAKQVIITRDSMTIIEGRGNSDVINKHIDELRAAIETAPSDLEKNNLKERLAKLTGGVGIIRIGGVSETEIHEKKDRVDDALHATKAAIEEGIVAGGGTMLWFAGECVKTLPKLDEVADIPQDVIQGHNAVLNALTEPLKQICENAGLNGEVIISKIKEHTEDADKIGININTGEIVNMFDEGIIDPAKVTKTAVRSAASVAGILLTTECAIIDEPELEE